MRTVGVLTPPFIGVHGRRDYTEAELEWLKKEYRQRGGSKPEPSCRDDGETWAFAKEEEDE